ncbi:hypothetical protein N7457_002871 [Penicillium paradoxum]|uniref:uncharacterized protein n=1 Tax=Penicillium paradoxum TaxID=176176 RepID=UPI002548C4CF|nr:uncharacterized protein N7457_002871 [Penicillium paradoxum]KAJ5787881.1 hypothetical protein N7457_002871 [Penicillium paradoxum]
MTITEDRPKLIMGIDFGTTFSGVAWGLEDCPDDIELIQTWPGGGNLTSQKVPTLCTYKDRRMKWGYQADLSSHPIKQSQAIQGFKLLLDESQKFRYKPAIESQAIIQDMNKTPINVAGDYLEKLVTHARDILARRFGTALQTMDMEYILTVPAVWSDKGKDSTLQAAYWAGIPNSSIRLLSEPEAAAVCAIRTIQPNAIAEGDCLIVCDAGGGTVDIITYRVKQKDPLRFEEATKGTGAVCGSVMLDERFDALVKDLIEKQSQKPLPIGTARTARQYWQDYVKPQYTGPLDEDDMCEPGYWVPVPGVSGVSNIELSGGHLYLDKDQVKDIFDPIIEQIEDLIAEQRTSVRDAGDPVKVNSLTTFAKIEIDFQQAIILVGGLGASAYLFKRLQATFSGIEIMQPSNAWSAVARGAVIRGQEGNQVVSRISRCNYGISSQIPYDPTKHNDNSEFLWCPYEEKWKVLGAMNWYIKKNQTLAEGEPVRMNFYRTVGIRGSLSFNTPLMFCQKAIAPEMEDSSVTTLCEMVADLSRIPRELFTKKRNSKGVEYYHISYDLVLTPTSASLLFDLEFNGISYGSVRSRY